MLYLKTTITLLLSLISFGSVFSQHQNTWKKANLTFETRNEIEDYNSGDSRIYDADNDYLGISLEEVDIREESEEFLNDVKNGCQEICQDMDMSVQDDGGSFMNDFESYYIICFDSEPVITAVIIRPDINRVYEISIYCYEIEISEGIEILKSMKFLK